jgi:HD-GYP domain-containing protein (c-di-GMP phosphodiesterase class II)
VSERTKHVCLVILAQAGCLGVGLWMQHHFVVSSTRTEVTEQAWVELDEGAHRILSYLSDVPLTLSDAETLDVVRFRRLAASAVSQATGVCIVDANWTVLFNEPAAAPLGGPELTVGAHVPWTAESGPVVEGAPHSRGAFEGPGGTQLAIAYALKNLSGYLIVHCPRAALEARTTAILSSRAAIGGLTWLWTSVLLSFSTYMVLARFHDESERARARSAAEGLQQRQKLLRTRDAVIFGLAKLADSRDPETGDHLERISVYSTTLASVLRNHPKFSERVTPAFVRLIGISSALHDIGKVGIEDRILLKPGPLTPDERKRIQEHAVMGGECLREIEQRLGSSNFLQMAREIAFAHHERWDGGGYPRGLKGEEIPLAARIVAIVDVYDALSSRRVYKGPRKHEECVAIIRKAAGTQFDADLVAVWLAIEGQFRDIARRYANVTPSEPRPEPPPAEAAQEAEYNAEKECLVASAFADDE